MAEKLFYSMGEVSEMFDVNPSLLRHWETQFSVLRPKRNKKGNRLYTPQDVENLKLIYHLVKEQGMTLEGARKALKRKRAERGTNRDMELLERLQRVRSMLEEVRAELQADDEPSAEEVVARRQREVAAQQLAAAKARRGRAVVQVDAEGKPLDVEDPAVESEVTAGGVRPRRPRRKKEEVESKELFAFYEQSLF